MGSIRAVATDLDGTLLDEHKRIHPDDVATIEKLKQKGVRIILATGRHHSLVRWYVRQLGGVDLVLASNGACVYDFAADKMLEAHFLSPEQVARVKEFSKRFEAPYSVYTKDFTCYLKDDPRMANSAEILQWGGGDLTFGKEIRFVEDTPDALEYPIFKVVFPFLTLAEQEELAGEFFDCALELYRGQTDSGRDYLTEIGPWGCSKGAALREAAQRLGFSLSDTLAMGDDYNDFSLLEGAGYPAAPENCREEVRPYARYITVEHNHGPLTDAVRHFEPELL